MRFSERQPFQKLPKDRLTDSFRSVIFFSVNSIRNSSETINPGRTIIKPYVAAAADPEGLWSRGISGALFLMG
jgi:hypothetical protein